MSVAIPSHDLVELPGDSQDETSSRSGARVTAAVRESALRRTRGFCEKCCSQKNAEFHHIVPKAHGGLDEDDNIALLCNFCHKLWHHTVEDCTVVNINELFQEWLLIPPDWFLRKFHKDSPDRSLDAAIELFCAVKMVLRYRIDKERYARACNYIGMLRQHDARSAESPTVKGLRRAKAEGRIGGRPRTLTDEQIMRAKALMKKGVIMSDICHQLGVSPSTIYRHIPGGRKRLESPPREAQPSLPS